MSRPLLVVPADDPSAVLAALKDALAGGPAVLPAAPALPKTTAPALPKTATPVPATVDQRIALVVETSGSTGSPKRVALSTDALLASAAASDAALGGAGQWLLALPAHYIAGINVLVRSIAAGTDPVILAPAHFEPSEFAAAATRLDAPLRFTSVVPVQLARLLDAADRDLDILEVLRRFDRILVGGQATPAALVERATELGLNLTRTYGSSETSGGCVYDGVPIGATTARVVDGEIQLAGPTLAEGYLADEARTEQNFLSDAGRRWYRTGDTGEVVDGVLSVTGRLDGILISGGVKVSLEAIERVLHSIDGLADAVAVRAPSAEWGEAPVVFSSGAARLDELRAIVVEALGRASAPLAFVRVESIPLLPSGKPNRQSLTSFAASRADKSRADKSRPGQRTNPPR